MASITVRFCAYIYICLTMALHMPECCVRQPNHFVFTFPNRLLFCGANQTYFLHLEHSIDESDLYFPSINKMKSKFNTFLECECLWEVLVNISLTIRPGCACDDKAKKRVKVWNVGEWQRRHIVGFGNPIGRGKEALRPMAHWRLYCPTGTIGKWDRDRGRRSFPFDSSTIWSQLLPTTYSSWSQLLPTTYSHRYWTTCKFQVATCRLFTEFCGSQLHRDILHKDTTMSNLHALLMPLAGRTCDF
jgi:hypothetical protein